MATVHYCRIEGSRSEKLAQLEKVTSIAELQFSACESYPTAPFRPKRHSNYFEWPLLTDAMPWQASGSQIKRTWPINPSKAVLVERWKRFLLTENRQEAFKETRDRTLDSEVLDTTTNTKLKPLRALDLAAPMPTIRRYGYRSFDRQYILADNRLGDYLRPSLWLTSSTQQLFFASLLTKPLGVGPALTVSPDVPDMDFFSGRGAKDIIPLYRDAAASSPNIHPDLLAFLKTAFERPISPKEWAAYLYCVVAAPSFTRRYEAELGSKELRVPVTLDRNVFKRATKLGADLIYLHTFGERFANGRSWPKARVKALKAIDQNELPDSIEYLENRQVLALGGGEIGPVSQGVWDYEISGLKVVQSWLGYRKRNRTGRKSSPLDSISSNGWTGEFTTELLLLLNVLEWTLEHGEDQDRILGDIVSGELLGAVELGRVHDGQRKGPSRSPQEEGLDL